MEVSRLTNRQDQYKRALEDQNAVCRTTKQATDELTKSLREQQDAFKKAYAEGTVDGAKTAALHVLELKRQSDQLSKAIRGVNSDFTTVSGSYNRLSLDTKALGDWIRPLPELVKRDGVLGGQAHWAGLIVCKILTLLFY